MFSHLLSLVILLPLNAQSTPEQINDLVAQLGDPRFKYRNAATEALVKMSFRQGLSVINTLKPHKNHKDLEIRMRVRMVLDRYYWVTSDNPRFPIPKINYLPDDIRYPNGNPEFVSAIRFFVPTGGEEPRDVAEGLVQQAKAKARTESGYADWKYRLNTLATYLYIRSRLEKGWPREEAQKLVNRMAAKQDRQSSNWLGG